MNHWTLDLIQMVLQTLWKVLSRWDDLIVQAYNEYEFKGNKKVPEQFLVSKIWT